MHRQILVVTATLLATAAATGATSAATSPRQATGTPAPPTSFPTREPEPTPGPSDPVAVAILRQSDEAMNRLSSLRIVEQRSDSSVPERFAPTYADYTFAAPDRFAYADRPEGNFWPVAHVVIGRNRWHRENGGPWQLVLTERPYQWPLFPDGRDPWLFFIGPPVNVRLEREEVLAGQPTWVISYQYSVRGIEGIIHYAITEWIAQDSHRLLRRVRTDDDAFGPRLLSTLDFTEFDGPVTILPPVTSGPAARLYLPRVLD